MVSLSGFQPPQSPVVPADTSQPLILAGSGWEDMKARQNHWRSTAASLRLIPNVWRTEQIATLAFGAERRLLENNQSPEAARRTVSKAVFEAVRRDNGPLVDLLVMPFDHVRRVMPEAGRQVTAAVFKHAGLPPPATSEAMFVYQKLRKSGLNPEQAFDRTRRIYGDGYQGPDGTGNGSRYDAGGREALVSFLVHSAVRMPKDVTFSSSLVVLEPGREYGVPDFQTAKFPREAQETAERVYDVLRKRGLPREIAFDMVRQIYADGFHKNDRAGGLMELLNFLDRNSR